MPQNNRVIFPTQALGFATIGSQTFIAAKGVQSANASANIPLDPQFELGQSAVYENVEDIPQIELTVQKVLDGYPLLYHLATKGSSTGTLFGRANTQSIVAMSVFPDTNDSASGAPVMQITMSGMYVSSVSYNFSVDGSATEDVTLVGNHRTWRTTATFSGGFDNNDSPLALTYNSGGVQRREDVLFSYTGITTTDANGQVNATPALPCTILPPDVAGISSSGTNELIAGTQNYQCSIQSISVSADLSRDQINELGHKSPYCRTLTIPVSVTTDIEIINKSGDCVNFTEGGSYNGNNTRNATIKVASRDGTFIDLGTKNRLSNISHGGGDTGGGNATITYTFETQNYFTVYHDQDPTSALAA